MTSRTVDQDDNVKSQVDNSSENSKLQISVLNLSCHACHLKGKTLQTIKCSRCPLIFCSGCLHRRYGEKIIEESEPGLRWVCPRCRGGCGRGYNNCCNCSKCRRNQGFPGAGKGVFKEALSSGFTNVHDFLIHKKTNETKEEIAKRKNSQEWTKAGGAKRVCTNGMGMTKVIGRDSLDVFGDVEMGIRLMHSWLLRKKNCVGNQFSITLLHQELQHIEWSKVKSHADRIRYDSCPSQLMNKPQHVQDSLMKEIQIMLQTKLEESKFCVEQEFERITKHLDKLKLSTLQELESTYQQRCTKAVQKQSKGFK